MGSSYTDSVSVLEAGSLRSGAGSAPPQAPPWCLDALLHVILGVRVHICSYKVTCRTGRGRSHGLYLL